MISVGNGRPHISEVPNLLSSDSFLREVAQLGLYPAQFVVIRCQVPLKPCYLSLETWHKLPQNEVGMFNQVGVAKFYNLEYSIEINLSLK